MRTARACALAIIATSVLAASPAAPSDGALREDLVARRARVAEAVGPDAVAIFWSAPPRLYSRTVHYPYRQDSDLLYLTGIDQEETILVLMPGNTHRREFLFILDADPRREHWDGHRLTPAEATALSGVETVLRVPAFEPFISAILSGRAPAVTSGEPGEHARFFTALEEGRARLALMLEPQPGVTAPPGRVRQFAADARDRFFGFIVQDATPVVHALRQIKTAYEQDVLRRSLAITTEAHRAGMRAAAPGGYEHQVQAAIEATYIRHGASWGYPSIVGSGPNATILHYRDASRRMEDGELLLVDAAARYRGLTGDVTRTYPVNGRFAPHQREIYELVLAAQAAGEKAARPGNRTRDVQAACEDVLRAGLLKLGLITDASGDQFRTWSTHGMVHWIGMDVHDVGSYDRPLEPGMAFVIEPGIYVREAALKHLPATADNLAFAEKVRPAVERYRDIGVRIEDSYLLAERGLERLSAGAPRTPAEIEAEMKMENEK